MPASCLHRLRRSAFPMLLLLALVIFAPPARAADERPRTGLLLMAHGGTPEWNAEVERAVAPLRKEGPVAIAYGMADRATLQAAVTELESRGVDRIAVVRLFLYKDSFLHQTEYFLGLRPDPPSRFLDHAGHASRGSGARGTAHAGTGHAGHGSGAKVHDESAHAAMGHG